MSNHPKEKLSLSHSFVSARLSVFLIALAVMIVGCLFLINGSDSSDATVVDSGDCGASLTWELDDDGTLTILGTGAMYDYYDNTAPWYPYRASITNVVISDGVTSLGNKSFRGCNKVTTVVMSDTVATADYYVFEGCESLRNVTLSTSLTRIGTGMFRECSSLQSVVIPEGVISIESQAFLNCTSLKSITLPSSLRTLDNCFAECYSLSSITLPEGLLRIEDGAFRYCRSLKTIDIPSTVIQIDGDSFAYCGSLGSITVNQNNTHFSMCQGALIDNDNSTLVLLPSTYKAEEYVVPNSITSIGSYCFYGNDSLKRIILHNGITTIGSYAFAGCSKLSSINLPNELTSISVGLFQSCAQLKTVTLPTNITSIGNGAFSSCRSLTSITIPANVETIGGSVFSECNSLKEVIVNPDNTHFKSIDGVLYDYGITSLIHYPFMRAEKTLNIPSTVLSIDVNSLHKCELSQIIVDSDNLTYSSSDGILFDKEKTQLICCPSYNELKTYVVPSTVTSIESSAFSNNKSLESITLNNGLLSIDYSAFNYCISLKQVVIPASVNVMNIPFLYCHSLESITVDPDNSNYSSEGGVLYNKTKTALLLYPAAKKDKSFSMPESVQSFYYSAFGYSYHLEELRLGRNVEEIDAFNSASCYLIKLKSITVDPNNPYYASDNGILYNKSKTDIVFCPSSWSGVLSIGESITGDLQYIFMANKGITAFEVDSNNPLYTSVDGVLYTKDMKGLIAYPAAKRSEQYTLPSTVERFGFAGGGGYGFCFNDYLKAIYVEKGNSHFVSINGCLCQLDGVVVLVPTGRGSIVIDNNLENRGLIFVMSNCTEKITIKKGINLLDCYILSDGLKKIVVEDASVTFHPSFSLGILDDKKHVIEVYAPEGFSFISSQISGNIELVYRPLSEIDGEITDIVPNEKGTYDVDYTGDEVSFPSYTISDIVEKAKNDSKVNMKIDLNGIVMIIDNTALKVLSVEDASLQMKEITSDKVDPKIKELVGESPVFDFSFGNNKDFGAGKITFEVKYVLAEGKDASNLRIYYIEGGEVAEKIDCTYDNGVVIFETNHLSTYAIVYEEPSSNGISPVILIVVGVVGALAVIGVVAFIILKRR